MNKKSLLVLGLGLIAVALVTALLLILNPTRRASETPPAPPPPQLGGGSTAQEAYRALQPWATDWSAENNLIALSASLQKVGQTEGGWTCQLYAPAKKKLAVVTVVTGEVRLLKEQTALYPQQTIDPTAWPLDSSDLFAQWWTERGAVIWSQPQAQSLYFQLSTQPDDTVTWTISVLSTEGKVLDFWEVNAATGEVIAGTH
ncbi:MAG: hypothetical protein U9Q70_13085 [Chloroflexota bacterium]|nr:hypothetical protein [Chloroflexota bacterium]